MKKSFAIVFGFIVLALLDSLMSYAMPVDFTFQHISVIWHCTFIALLVFVRDKPLITRLLIGMLVGILFDYFINDSFPFCFFFYACGAAAIGFIAQTWDRTGVLFTVCLLFCFLLDFLPFCWQKVTGITQIGFGLWFLRMESMTLIVNMAAIAVIMYFDLVMVRFFLIQKHRRRREEKKTLRKARLARTETSIRP